MNYDIDFVIAWVDGNDEAWQQERDAWREREPVSTLDKWNHSAARYRDWGLLRYWFRGVEAYAPYVRRIHFVTCGQQPAWLNTAHPKLHLVHHRDYIPAQYLPTFSSHCIELNLHRIPDLAEHFVYFNDDMFLISHTRERDFFDRGLPCDSAIISPVTMVQNGIRAEINNLYVINDHFDKTQVLRENPGKWFNPRYGKQLLRTFLMLPFHHFSGFYINHLPISYLKKTYKDVWNTVPELLNETCLHRFRTTTDVNQWLFENWQYVTGNFSPRSPGFGFMAEGKAGLSELDRVIRGQRARAVCCNDSTDIEDFDAAARTLRDAFEEILPKKSSFEL